MSLGGEPGRTPSTDEGGSSSGVEAFGAVLVAGVVVVVLGGLCLIMLGLGVHGLSTVVGMPLPYVHDDPDRVEWDGIAELAGYGLAGALVLYGLYRLAQRVLPASARRHIGRVIGVAVLLLLAAAGAVAAFSNWDLRAAAFAAGCGYVAYLVARGLPLDNGEED